MSQSLSVGCQKSSEGRGTGNIKPKKYNFPLPITSVLWDAGNYHMVPVPFTEIGGMHKCE